MSFMRGLGFQIFASDMASNTLRTVGMNLKAMTAASIKSSSAMFGAFGTMIAGTAALSAGMMGLGLAFRSVKEATGFQFAMERVGIVTRATGPKFDELTDAAKRLGLETEFTATEVAEAMQVLGQAGFDAGQISDDLASVVLDLTSAAGGMISTTQAASTVAVAWKLFGSEFKAAGLDVRDAADMMTRATQMSLLQFDELQKGFAGISGEAKAFNQTYTETLALITASKDFGFNATAGANALRIAMRNLISNNDRLLKATNGTVSAYNKAKTEFRSFIDVVDDLDQHWKRLGKTEEEKTTDIIDIFTKRGLRGMSILLKGGFVTESGQFLEGIEAIRARVAALENSEGAVASAAERMRETLSGTLQRIKGSLINALILVGTTMLPLLEKIFSKIFDITVVMNRWLASHKGWIKIGVAIGIATSMLSVFVGVLLLAIGGLAMAGLMMKMMGFDMAAVAMTGAAATVSTTALTTAFNLLNATLALTWALLWPIAILTVSAMTAMAVAIPIIWLLYKGFESNSLILKALAGALVVVIGLVMLLAMGPLSFLAANLLLVGAVLSAIGYFIYKVAMRMQEWANEGRSAGRRLAFGLEPIKVFFEALWMLLNNNFRLTHEMFDEVNAHGLIGALTVIGSLFRWIERGIYVMVYALGVVFDILVTIGALIATVILGPLGAAVYFLLVMFKDFIQFLTGQISFGEFWKAMKTGIVGVATSLYAALKWAVSKAFEVESDQWWAVAKFLGKVLAFAILSALVLGVMGVIALIGAGVVFIVAAIITAIIVAISALILAVASTILGVVTLVITALFVALAASLFLALTAPILLIGSLVMIMAALMVAVFATIVTPLLLVAFAIWGFVEILKLIASSLSFFFKEDEKQGDPNANQIEARKTFLINQKRSLAGMEVTPDKKVENDMLDAIDNRTFGKGKEPRNIITVQVGNKVITDAIIEQQADEDEAWGHSPTPLLRGATL